MRFDLTPENPAKWWVWTDEGWRYTSLHRFVVYGHETPERIAVAAIDINDGTPPYPVTLSETPPDWRPEQ